MAWEEIIRTVNKIAELSRFSVEEISNIVGSEFNETKDGRVIAEQPSKSFESVEIKKGIKNELVIFNLRLLPENEEYLHRTREFGEPINIDIISPPIQSESEKYEIEWERKYGICYRLQHCLVWFGVEERKSKEYLVSISIHKKREDE